MSITPAQMREAQLALSWSRERLASKSDTSVGFIVNYEDHGQIKRLMYSGPPFDALAAIHAAFEAAGVEFFEQNGGGLGVRLQRGQIS